MIAGNYTATSPQSRSIVYWQCGAGGPLYDTIPSCTGNYANQPVRGDISFPSCWDGVHLDSADHKSHMAYASSNGTCPASHPVSLPKINIELWFPSLFNGAGYVVASDSTSRGGISLHGDFYAAWDNQTQNALVTECLNNSHTCIGINRSDDGRRMFIQQGDPYPAITITTANYPATSPYSNLQTPVITSPVQPQSQTPTTTTSTGHNGHGGHAASPSPSPAATPTPASSTSTETPEGSNEAIEAQTASAVESKRSFASLLLFVGSVVVVVGTALMIYQYFRHNRGY
jgi:hypothetical protein